MNKNDVIIRPDYLNNIKPFVDLKMIKIFAGVRRSGKSYLLDMVGDELLSRGVKRDHIIYKLYTSIDFKIKDSIDMFKQIGDMILDDDRYYLLLDEVQEVDEWEKAINSLFEKYNVDIYVTGSNSKLTSEKISSFLSGRYILIPVYTLSFKEYLDFKNIPPCDEAYNEYKRFGGFPLIANSNLSSQDAYQVIDGIYHSIITKDILKNHPIKDIEKFERIVKFLMDNMGKTFSANSISNYMKSQHREISVESIYNYIAWLKDAFIIYECNRYDLKGKNVLKTQEKYYISDISLRYALFGYNNKMDDAILENIIFLELKKRGYEVYIGKNNSKEIDFIAKKRGEEIQIQATVKLPLNSDREIGNLKEIKDFNHKYVITTSRNDVQTIDGIKVMHIVDFLLLENF